MAPLQVGQVSRADAAQVMRGAGLRAPIAHHTPEKIAAHGECFQLTTGEGAGVFVLRRDAAVMWIDGAGARVHSRGLTDAGLALCEEIARQAGCTEIAFETNRRGLVRKSSRHGYRVAGFILKKAISP
jgi:hypothetical protein